MRCHYGEIISSEGVDGDPVDVFLGPNPDAKCAYIVRQVEPSSGKFDEQKVMLGFDTIIEAKRMYLAHYDTPAFFGGISRMSMGEFKRKALASLHGPRLIKSLAASDQKEVDAETAQISLNKQQPTARKSRRFKPAKWTHPNGHPRCLICGNEEPVGGRCKMPAAWYEEQNRRTEKGLVVAKFHRDLKRAIGQSDGLEKSLSESRHLERAGKLTSGEYCPHCGAIHEQSDGKCNRCGKSWPLEKGMIEGHWRTTHGGKRVWVGAYEDKRIVAQRPDGEQRKRAGDSGVLFPEFGFVRPIPQKVAPRPAPPMVHQMSLFGSEKSIEEMDDDGRPAWWGIAREENPMPDDEPVFWMVSDIEGQLKRAAFAAALRTDARPSVALPDSARRLAQAHTLANACFGGKVGAENLGPCLQAVNMEPISFRFALRALRDALRVERDARHHSSDAVEEIPL